MIAVAPSNSAFWLFESIFELADHIHRGQSSHAVAVRVSAAAIAGIVECRAVHIEGDTSPVRAAGDSRVRGAVRGDPGGDANEPVEVTAIQRERRDLRALHHVAYGGGLRIDDWSRCGHFNGLLHCPHFKGEILPRGAVRQQRQPFDELLPEARRFRLYGVDAGRQTRRSVFTGRVGLGLEFDIRPFVHNGDRDRLDSRPGGVADRSDDGSGDVLRHRVITK